jgi:hypothetical protein
LISLARSLTSGTHLPATHNPDRELPPPQPPPSQVTRITIPPIHPPTRSTSPLVGYLDKACALPVALDYSIPPGSSADPSILLCPTSPRTPFEFPVGLAEETYCDFNVTDAHPLPGLTDSVTQVVGLSRVCGLSLEEDTFAHVHRTTTASNRWDNPSLVDGGANICLSGVLDLLVDVESITPLPISVATKTGTVSLDDCCTKWGLLPLTLANGSLYYTPCYYCKNAVETIISPQAILAASDVLVSWTQTGHKDGSPGRIRFDSENGLYSISMTLENHEGLYYCPTDVFTVAKDPVRYNIPTIRRATAPTQSSLRRHNDLTPVPYSRLAESELWMLRLGSPGEEQLDQLPEHATGLPHKFQYHPFRFMDWKEEARIQRQAAGKSAVRTTEVGRRFYMDFGFTIRARMNFMIVWSHLGTATPLISSWSMTHRVTSGCS